MTMPGQEEPTLGVVAAAYELYCGCELEGAELLNVQLSELDRSEEDWGLWVWVCPACQFRHCFDGGEVNHAF